MSIPDREPVKVLFICLGNICRSPIAEAVFRYICKEKCIPNFEVDSAAIATFNLGRAPDHRARAVMKKHSISMKHIARQIDKKDFFYYDYIIGMDNENMSDLKHILPKASKTKLVLFGSYDPMKKLLIRDPYFDDDNDESGFEECYNQCVRCTNGFLASLEYS